MKILVVLAQLDDYETEPFIIGCYSSLDVEKAKKSIKDKVAEIVASPCLYGKDWCPQYHPVVSIIPVEYPLFNSKNKDYNWLPFTWTNNDERIESGKHESYDLTFEVWEVEDND